MHQVFRIIILLTILLGFNACNSKQTVEEQSITVDVLPFPNKVLKRGGVISLSNNIWVIANVSDSTSSELATYLVKRLVKLTSGETRITDIYSTRKHQQSIKIELDNNTQAETAESYTIDITSSQIIIKAKSARGIYYGIQTLLQMLKAGEENGIFKLPKIIIKDSPNYSIRGVAIKQSQINDISVPDLFQLLGLIKINAVFVIDDNGYDPILKSMASENYIKLYTGQELPGDVVIFSYGASTTELADFYKTFDLNSELKGVVLDLTSTSKENFQDKLSVLAELSWSEKDKYDFSRLSGLAKKIFTNE